MFLTQLLGFTTKNISLYEKALKHKSYNCTDNNERLEFLGDAILNQIISEELFRKNKNKGEGFLSKERSRLVSRRHLNQVGKTLIKESQIKNKLENMSEKIYGDTLEAVIAAIYIDKGMVFAKKFIKDRVINNPRTKKELPFDHKTELQKLLHKKKREPEYKIINTKGPDHKKQFTIAVFVKKRKLSSATGFSIKEAEQEAAKKALNIVF